MIDVTERRRVDAERDRLLVAARQSSAEAEQARRELAEQNERLLELDRLKDEFVALVSHELRSPLTSIRGYLELVLDGHAGDVSEDQRQFLEVVQRGADRLLHLVGDLLFVAQVQAGALTLELAEIDLRDLASQAIEAARPAAEQKGIDLVGTLNGAVPVVGDRDRLAQLVDNLLSNALKFTSDGGQVEIVVAHESRRASAGRPLGDRGEPPVVQPLVESQTGEDPAEHPPDEHADAGRDHHRNEHRDHGRRETGETRERGRYRHDVPRLSSSRPASPDDPTA